MKVLMIFACLFTGSVIAKIGFDAAFPDSYDNLNMRIEGRSLFIGKSYNEIRKGALKSDGVRVFSSSSIKETLVYTIDKSDPCFTTFDLDGNTVIGFSVSGKCKRD